MTRQQFLNKIKQKRQLLPLLLLTAYCIDAIITAVRGTVVMAGVTYSFLLTTKHYLAFLAIGGNLFTYFLLRPFYKYTLGLTIAVGLFNLVTFSALETTQSFAFGSLKIGFQPSAFFAGLLAYFVNFKRVNRFLIENLGAQGTPEEQEKNGIVRFVEEVKKFKVKYESYSVGDLREIITESKFVPEAIEAARQLLKEKQPNGDSN